MSSRTIHLDPSDIYNFSITAYYILTLDMWNNNNNLLIHKLCNSLPEPATSNNINEHFSKIKEWKDI